MNNKVLVAYASKYGSTQEVAEAVAKTLSESGLIVDLQPMRNVRTLAGYGTVVLGAPLYMMHWHKDALQFLSRHQQAITKLPVAVFALGPTNNKEEDWREIRAMLDQELAKYPWFKPVALELFGGKYDPAKLRFPYSLLVSLPASPLHDLPASDVRDWAAIEKWAAGLAGKLQPVHA